MSTQEVNQLIQKDPDFVFCSMDGGELFSRIQDRGDQAFTERGKKSAYVDLKRSNVYYYTAVSYDMTN